MENVEKTLARPTIFLGLRIFLDMLILGCSAIVCSLFFKGIITILWFFATWTLLAWINLTKPRFFWSSLAVKIKSFFLELDMRQVKKLLPIIKKE